jgi:hypothetical protein
VNRTRKWWVAAICAAFILTSLTTGVSAAAAGSASPRGLGAAERRALPFGTHALSAAERRGLPASLRSVAVAISGPWYIRNNGSNKYMEVYHSQTQNGAKVDQYHFNGTATQKWMMVAVDTNRTQWSFVNVNSSKCLDNTGTLANGTQMTIWQCSDTTNFNQIFWVYSPVVCNVSGCWNFGPWRGGANGKCVEVYHSSTADYAKVDEWDCNGTPTQQWFRAPA